MPIVLFDASTPTRRPQQADGAMIYGGGDTPHVWTQDEIDAYAQGYRLPVFVRSNPDQASPITDAADFVRWLFAIHAPAGIAVLLDLETAVNAAYVTAFAGLMHAAGFKVLEYGSSSTLQENPPTDGYFVALPGQEVIPDWAVGVQYQFSGDYDLSEVRDTVPLWNTTPAPDPAPQPVKGTTVQLQYPPLRGAVAIVNGRGNLTKEQVTDWDGSCPVSVVPDGSDGGAKVLTFDSWSADGRLDFTGLNGGPWGFSMWVAAPPAS